MTWVSARDAVVSWFDEHRRPSLAEEFENYQSAEMLLMDFREDVQGRNEWFTYRASLRRLDELGFSPVIGFAITERMPAMQVPVLLERAFLTTWIAFQLRSDSRLSPGDSGQRSALIAEYRELDAELRDSAASTIISAINARRPKSNAGQAGVITREAEKKIRHIAVRRLIDEARDVIQIIQPCFMMSPLAVSQYLPPDIQFDVVIFDEASQVSPGDAINCTYRGRALITAGDQRQLPPSSFFSVSEDGDGSEEVGEDDFSADYESVLDLMKSSGNFNALTLRWHYRSRHEHLITYSNASFYKSRLITFPSAQNVSDDLGVKFYKVPGVYQRANGSNNPIEAQAVAQRVFDHFRTRPDRSCGVVTFSTAQRDAVEHAVEELRLVDPSMEKYFRDDRLNGFFVKSLESVQGDERDVIIFSIGYGPTATGQVYKNFGALNRPGGERRLNVAITRARYLVEIVSSMSSGDIGEVQNEGARHLRRYLDFAERGPAALEVELGPEGLPTESPFEDSVLDVLGSWGYQVQPQVGVAGYRIDLGVIHPDHTGAFMLGIECDGAMYHSSKSARDRDRLRHEVLSGLGWDIYHIWGTSWYRNQAAERDKLKAALEAAVRSPIEGRLASRVGGPRVVDAVVVERQQVDFAHPAAWVRAYVVAEVAAVNRYLDISDESTAPAIKTTVQEIVAAEGPLHVDLLAQRFRELMGYGRTGSRRQATIDRAVKLAGVQRDGPFLSLPGQEVSYVRTPVPRCNRTVDQVSDGELGLAIESTVVDTMGIARSDLIDTICRLFQWQRRIDTVERVGRLIEKAVQGGKLRTEGVRITPSVSGVENPAATR